MEDFSGIELSSGKSDDSVFRPEFSSTPEKLRSENASVRDLIENSFVRIERRVELERTGEFEMPVEFERTVVNSFGTRFETVDVDFRLHPRRSERKRITPDRIQVNWDDKYYDKKKK